MPSVSFAGHFFADSSGNIINAYYPFNMMTDGINKQMSGCKEFQQDDSTWLGLTEALAYLEWLEFQEILWGYGSMPSNSPNRDRLN